MPNLTNFIFQGSTLRDGLVSITALVAAYLLVTGKQKKVCRGCRHEALREERLCSGQLREISCYRTTEELLAVIRASSNN